jgi:hypothetical protein
MDDYNLRFNFEDDVLIEINNNNLLPVIEIYDYAIDNYTDENSLNKELQFTQLHDVKNHENDDDVIDASYSDLKPDYLTSRDVIKSGGKNYDINNHKRNYLNFYPKVELENNDYIPDTISIEQINAELTIAINNNSFKELIDNGEIVS